MGDILQEERREYPRLGFKTPVQFVSENEMNNARIEDISAGGCRLKSSVPLSKNAPIIMQFSVDDADIIVKGTPAWEARIPEEEAYYIGVMFTDISKKTKERLVEYISEMKDSEKSEG